VFDSCPETFQEENLELGLQSIVDSDGDIKADACDFCPEFRSENGLNIDSDRNGIGDDCECGDQNEDGTVDVKDILAINDFLFGREPVGPLCDANESGGCTPDDILAVNLKIYGMEGYCLQYPSP
jgi:hypothetical protein